MRKNKQKNTSVIVLALLLSLSLIAGCGRRDSGSSSASEEPEVMNTTVLKADPADYLDTSLIAATSTVHGGGFDASYISDMDPTTAWAEGAYDEGAGECLMLEIPEGTVVTGGLILPGYWRSKKAFQEYAAPTRISVSSGEDFQEVSLSKYTGKYKNNFQGYEFKLRKSIVSNGIVRVFITDTRSGKKFPHSCISELHLKGKLPKEIPESTVTMNDLVSSTNAAFDLSHRLECIYKNHMGWPQTVEDITITTEGLTPEDKAFALYQYQYFITDARIHYDSETLNKSTKSELTGIMEELFGPVGEGDMQCFYDNYVKKIKKETCKMPATGDFGAGDWMFFTDVNLDVTDTEVMVQGHVYQYDENGSSYIGGQFTGVFDLPAGDSGNCRFRSLTVSRAVG